jgi:hypothetical protein
MRHAICLAFLSFSLSLSAQTVTSLNGLVTDPTGATIPGANLTLVSKETNAQREAVSDSSGRYQFPALTPGFYQLKATKSGFSNVSVQDIRLLVNTPATINIAFENVGSVATTIEVSAEATQLNTVDATLGKSFGTKPILQLPFEGRNVAKILSLQAGVSWVGDTDSVNGGVSTATDRGGVVNGGRSDQSNITLDGIDVNDQQTRAAFNSVLRVTLDSVQEFRVTTSNANADSSRGSGAQVTLVTKSGTNELHGSLYHYLRNKATNANTFFNNLAGVKTPKLNRNIFGGSIGGVVPNSRKKLFFFGNYEGRRDAFEQSVLRVVPTATLRQGITRYVARGGNVVNVSPQELTSKLGYAPGINQAVLDVFSKYYPLPNDSTAGDGINSSGFRFNAPLKNKFDTFVARFDYVLNDKHTFFLRGQLQDDVENGAPQFPNAPPNSQSLTNSKGLAVGWNAVIRPTLFSTTRFGLTRQSLEDAGIGQYPLISFRTFADPIGTTRSFRRISPTYNLTQDFNWTRGAHSIQFGGSYRNYSNDRLSYANSYFAGAVNSSWMTASGGILSAPFVDANNAAVGISTGGRTQFNDAVAAVLGLVTQVTSNYNYLPQNGQVTALAAGMPNPRKFRGEESEIYLQDSWKVTRGLTITGGIRYMYWPAIYEVNGVQTSTNIPLSEWFDRRVANASAGLGGQTGLPPISYNLAGSQGSRPLYDNLHNWSPRLAIAYSPQGSSGLSKFLFGGAGKSVIRAGWGMYYDVFGAGLVRAFDATALGLSTSLNNSSGRLTLEDTPRYTGISNLPPSLVTPPPPASFPVTQPNNFAITNSLDDKLRAPYVMRWNFTMSRELPSGWTVNLGYVASEGRRTLNSEDLATPLNIRDPQSGQDWYGGAAAVISQLNINNRNEIQRPLTAAELGAVKPVPFFENMFPGLARNGLTATQGAIRLFEPNFPDSTYILELTDRLASPTASRLGTYAFYSPQFSYLRALRSVGSSSYHSMQFGARKSFRNGDQLDFNWTWSHSFDMGSVTENQASAENRGTIINPYNRSQMRASSDFDQRHNWNANYVYNLPFGANKRFLAGAGKVVNFALGGWQLAGLMRITTGLPVSVGHNRTWPTNYNITGWATQVGPAADGTNKNAPASVAGQTTGANIFQNPQAALDSFGFTLPGQIGNRNNIRGDGVTNVDLSLAKNFTMPYRESHKVQFRWEVFNVTNTVRFDPLNINLSLGNRTTFGRYQGTLQPSRVMQFSLRYDF